MLIIRNHAKGDEMGLFETDKEKIPAARIELPQIVRTAQKAPMVDRIKI